MKNVCEFPLNNFARIYDTMKNKPRHLQDSSVYVWLLWIIDSEKRENKSCKQCMECSRRLTQSSMDRTFSNGPPLTKYKYRCARRNHHTLLRQRTTTNDAQTSSTILRTPDYFPLRGGQAWRSRPQACRTCRTYRSAGSPGQAPITHPGLSLLVAMEPDLQSRGLHGHR